MNSILEKAEKLQGYITEMRRYLHENPELSTHEEHTSKFIAENLKKIGYDVTEGIGGFGLIGVINEDKKGPVIALRADMDALQVNEANDVEYKSKNQGVMHACGHDAHMSMLLGAARILYDMRSEIDGCIKVIFQPAEELSPIGGSKAMIKSGVLDDVDHIFGLHVWPDIVSGKFGVKSGALMASSDHFTIDINGKSSHAAEPHKGIDAVVAGAHFITAVQNIMSRKVDPFESAVVTIGVLRAGTRYNVIADNAFMEGTCRTYSEDVRCFIEKELQNILDGICTMYGVTGTLNYERGYCSLVNDEKDSALAKKSICSIFGEDAVIDVEKPSMCGEDFAFYLREKPGCFLWMGTGKEGEKVIPLHNACFNIDESILWKGAAALSKIAVDAISEEMNK